MSDNLYDKLIEYIIKVCIRIGRPIGFVKYFTYSSEHYIHDMNFIKYLHWE